jgi:hypothetical protein
VSKFLVNTPLRGHTKGETVQPGAVIEIDDKVEAKSLVECGAVSAIPEVAVESAKTAAKK